jgi:hypothetical protein
MNPPDLRPVQVFGGHHDGDRAGLGHAAGEDTGEVAAVLAVGLDRIDETGHVGGLGAGSGPCQDVQLLAMLGPTVLVTRPREMSGDLVASWFAVGDVTVARAV